MTTICYKMKNPVYYNKGTKWEKSSDEFLAYYTYKSVEDAKKEVEEINSNKPEKLETGAPVNWDEVAYFFVNEQSEMY